MRKKVLTAMLLVLVLVLGSASESFAMTLEEMQENNKALAAAKNGQTLAKIDRTLENTVVLERGGATVTLTPPEGYDTPTDLLTDSFIVRYNDSAMVGSKWNCYTDVGESGLVSMKASDEAHLGIHTLTYFRNTTYAVYNFYAFVVDTSKVSLWAEGRKVHIVCVKHSVHPENSEELFQIQTKTKNGKWKTASNFSSSTLYKASKSVSKVRVRRVNYDSMMGTIYGKWTTLKL